IRPHGTGPLGVPLVARIFRLRTSDPQVKRLLVQMFENEQRVLSTISPRPEGRGLLAFHEAWSTLAEDRLVLISEWHGVESGVTTMREVLRGPRPGLFQPRNRAELWGHLRVLVEAVGALHRAGFIHRSLRPESVLVHDVASDDPDDRPAFK